MLLQTERLLLRPFDKADFPLFASLMADPDVMRFSIGGPLSQVEAEHTFAKRILDHYQHHGFGLLAVFLRETQAFLGFIGLITQLIDGVEEVELAYRLFPVYWNQGFAVEAAQAICAYGFRELQIERIISIIDPENHKSLRVAHKLGMHFWKTSLFHGIPTSIYCLKKITIVPFQSMWSKRFEQEKNLLKHAFQGLEISFHHIGSTSIPACAAKPIIDILGITSDVSQVDGYNDALIALGYLPKGEYGIRQRRYFQKRPTDAVNLHIFEDSNPEVERHLRFCSYLRKYPEKAQEYSVLKSYLAQQFPHDIHSYILGKERWIKTIDKLAAEEFIRAFPAKKRQRKQFSSLNEIVRAMEANMYVFITYFTHYLPTLELIFEPDVTVVRSEIPDDTFNYVMFAKFNEKTVRTRVVHILNLYKKSHLPLSWWISESDTPSILAETLQKEGLLFKEENVGMYVQCEDFSSFTPPPSLHLQRVLSAKEIQDFCQVIVEVGGNTQIFEHIYRQLPPVLYTEGSSFEIYIGYVDHHPVVTGILLLDAHVAGIYYITTSPSQRKKGYARAMMEYLLHRARSQGYSLATLQASQQGKSLYEKLGFKKCCLFQEYKAPGW